MKVRQTTRILSPSTRMVRDVLQRILDIDSCEIKDERNMVIGWQIPKEKFAHHDMVNQFTVNDILRVARSESTDPTTKLTIVKYTHRLNDLLLETTIFPEFLTITLQ